MEIKSIGGLRGAFFGLLFVLAGLGMAYFSAGKPILKHIESASWVEVPATIHSVKLETHRGKKSSTYSVKSNYSYLYNGVNYSSTRSSFSSGNDNIGSYWQDLHKELRKLKQSNEATAIVNPLNPPEAVLDRTLRWEVVIFALVFIVLFVGLGGFLMFTSLLRGKSRKHDYETRVKMELPATRKTMRRYSQH